MSLATIRNGLASTLTACGPWSANEISTCSLDPLESVSGLQRVKLVDIALKMAGRDRGQSIV